ncbi:MAG: C_GCAxxG_C_C family protein [Deltaproteobacteria bacterium]|nr:C_GCAxxG_C_C family protein [Deltaproteobacteria bacterium]
MHLIPLKERDLPPEMEEISRLTEERAKDFFLSKQLYCSEAVLVTLNHGLGGGMTDDLAIRISSTLPEGLAGSGCLCGALGGAVLALGLFLGRDWPGSQRDSHHALVGTRELHDLFVKRFGATCCRVLSKEVKHLPKQHFEQCAGLTGAAAAFATEIVLRERPRIIRQVDYAFLNKRESKMGSLVRKAVNFMI